jgi:hypothetical protein
VYRGGRLVLIHMLGEVSWSQQEDERWPLSILFLDVFSSLLQYTILVRVSSRSSAPTGLFINYILFVDSLSLKSFHPFLPRHSTVFDYFRYSSPASIELF